jgi:hypothetical protein
LKAKSFVESLEKKMIDIENYMESISKRFENHDNHFKNLTDEVKRFEVTHREYSTRLSRLENRRNTDENEDFELQQVKNVIYLLF